MKKLIAYPYQVEPAEEGGYLVQFFDFDEAFTEANTLEEAHTNAAEVLNLSLEGRINDGLSVPKPSDAEGKNIYFATPAVY